MLRALWAGLLAGPIPHDAKLTKTFRVWPHDLDVFGHMNNGRYLQIMDVARAEWMVRSGVVSNMRKQRWGALLGGGATRFNRTLKLWQRYKVRTRLLCWDSRWFYIEHLFTDLNGRKIAIGVSRAALRHTNGWVHTNKVVAAIAPGALSPAEPEYLSLWRSLDDAMFMHSQCDLADDPILAEVSL